MLSSERYDKPMLEKNSKNQIPNANSPELLIRLIDAVARGIRTPRGLQENLGVELANVQGYIEAGEWLGFLEAQGDVWLTPLGLEFAFAGKKQPIVYARAVWRVPFVRTLMDGAANELPATERFIHQLAIVYPNRSESELLQHAKALRNLIAPGVLRAPPKAQAKPNQLELPLAHGPETVTHMDLSGLDDREFDPEVYRYFLTQLLDYGELNLGHIRALLDAALAQNTSIGGLIAMTKSRGDANQIDDRIVLTTGAVERMKVVRSVESIILSDPDYRQYLNHLLEDSGLTGQGLGSLTQRHKSWHRRIFGAHTKPAALRHQLQQVLLDRSLDSFPIAGESGVIPTVVQRSFLEIWNQPDLMLCCPPSLKLLMGGLDAVNRRLRAARGGSSSVGIPDLSECPIHIHGGLMHPGERLPKNVPDTLSLRLRALMNAPYLTLVAAILLGQRLMPEGPALETVSGRWMVRYGNRNVGPLLAVIDTFARSRQWVPCRRAPSPVTAQDLIQILESLGVTTSLSRGTVLSEKFFASMRTDVEEMEVHRQLRPLAEVFVAWLKTADPIQGTGSSFGEV